VKTTAALSRQSCTPEICARAYVCVRVCGGERTTSNLAQCTYLALQVIQHAAKILYGIFLDLDACR
jgi:hypothetical protein